MHLLSYLVAALAILVMGLDVVLAFRVRSVIVSGELSAKFGLLIFLVAFFFVGYLFPPLALYDRPGEYLDLLVFAVFLYGAVFVWVVIGTIRDTLAFAKLLK
jgi:hypothetical protein